jgi:hypothetical protein
MEEAAADGLRGRVEGVRGCDFQERGERRGDGDVDRTVQTYSAWSFFC